MNATELDRLIAALDRISLTLTSQTEMLRRISTTLEKIYKYMPTE